MEVKKMKPVNEFIMLVSALSQREAGS